MFMHPDLGDTFVELTQFMSLEVENQSLVFCRAREFEYCANIPGYQRYVKAKQEEIILETSLISRKVILVDETDEGGEGKYLVVDYMRRIFPVTPGTVVVPYYPEAHDMVNVKGGTAGEIWKAHVIRFSLPRKTVTAQFFKDNPLNRITGFQKEAQFKSSTFQAFLQLHVDTGQFVIHAG